MGFETPHGQDPRGVFERLFQGESAVQMVRSGTAEFGSDVVLAPVDFDPGDTIPKVPLLFMARAAQMAVVAAHKAIRSTGLLVDDRGPRDAGVYMGCGLGGAEIIQEGYRTFYEQKSKRFKRSTVPMIMANAAAAHISMRYKIQGPAHTYSIACSSSTVAIGEAFRAVRDGYLEVAIAGGTEAMLNHGSIAAWERLVVLGEGAVILVIENEDRVSARRATPVAEIIGYGSSSDAHNLIEPLADGQERTMWNGILDSGIDPGEVGYINAHATGTPTGDPVEIDAIKRVFGAHARQLAVSSTKSMHGHLVGAAGALECAITALALSEGRIPPTANLTTPDPACDLDCVPGVGRAVPDLAVAMSNSFAFGGSNATLVLRKA
jgi:3-oxoacyl-[acyl-carrier-protein] synthase II